MKIKKTGDKDNESPALKMGECIFVDMWGNWAIFEYGYTSFQKRVDEFVSYRQSKTSYFNPNYIIEYKVKNEHSSRLDG